MTARRDYTELPDLELSPELDQIINSATEQADRDIAAGVFEKESPAPSDEQAFFNGLAEVVAQIKVTTPAMTRSESFSDMERTELKIIPVKFTHPGQLHLVCPLD